MVCERRSIVGMTCWPPTPDDTNPTDITGNPSEPTLDVKKSVLQWLYMVLRTDQFQPIGGFNVSTSIIITDVKLAPMGSCRGLRPSLPTISPWLLVLVNLHATSFS